MAKILHIEPLLQRYPSKLSAARCNACHRRAWCVAAAVPARRAALQPGRQAARRATLELKRLQKEAGATTLFVTHDQIEAMSMSDKVVVIHQVQSSRSEPRPRFTPSGEHTGLQHCGTPDELASCRGRWSLRIKSNGHLTVCTELPEPPGAENTCLVCDRRM